MQSWQMVRVVGRSMVVVINPFKPTAGKMPPILIGRQSIIEDFSEALTNGVGAPGRIMLVTGARGTGKTVMLTEIGRASCRERVYVLV